MLLIILKMEVKGKRAIIKEGSRVKGRSEINEKEMKETIAKINKTKSWFFEKINKKIGRAHV